MAENRRKYWRKPIAEQEVSGQKARPFCRERGIGEYSFYKWRLRLRQSDTVQFALLETFPAATASLDSALELVLRNGERLRIGNQVATTLRTVLEVIHLPASVRVFLCLNPLLHAIDRLMKVCVTRLLRSNPGGHPGHEKRRSAIRLCRAR
jgi:hypothetical protein